MSIVVVPRAQVDIDLASEEIEERSGVWIADRFQAELTRLFGRLEALPLSAAAVDPPHPKHPGLRLSQVPRFPHQVVYYFPTPTGIRVARVIHSSRDADAIFG